MIMELDEFKTKVCKKCGPKKAKVSNSWGVYDAYKHIRHNKWYGIGRVLTEHEFYSIIRNVNRLLANEIANGNTVVFPARMGKLELRKHTKGVSLVDGKLKVTYPVDWKSTLELWFYDEQARKDKTLLRTESKNVYHVRYNKHDANYENQNFYEFALNRFIKLALKDNINKGVIETLW